MAEQMVQTMAAMMAVQTDFLLVAHWVVVLELMMAASWEIQ